MIKALKHSLTLTASAFALYALPAIHAQTLTFNVDINTAALQAQDGANGPFDLDFQLNYGNSSLAASTATLSNFVLTGGSATGSAVATGSATGSLNSGSVALTANSAHTNNELYQQFTSGVTDIQFTATVTETGPDIGTPTSFTTAILDNSLGSPAQLYTTAPDTASLVTLSLNSANTLSNVGAYTSTFSADGNTPVTGVTASISAIPEPSTTAAIIGGAALLIAFYARRSGKLQIA